MPAAPAPPPATWPLPDFTRRAGRADPSRDRAVTRFHQARAFAAAKVNQIRKAATEQAGTIRDYAQEKGVVIRDKAKHLHEASEEYVKEKPTQSMLIAMGVGLLIGLLIRRR